MGLVIVEDPAPARALNAKIPRDLETICLKCLRKESAKRYVTASALADDLRRFLECQPIQSRPVSRAEKSWLWCRRRPAVAASVAGILLTVFIVWGLIVFERQRTLRDRVEVAVTSVGTSHGSALAAAIGTLQEFPQQIVLSELRRQLETADQTQCFPLQCALAHYGTVQVDELLSCVKQAAPGEVENIVAALSRSRAEAVSSLSAAIRTAESEENWRCKARLAMLAVHLDELSSAREMCALRPDPTQRTWFVEECSTWHGDLTALAQLAAGCDDGPLRTAIAQAAGTALARDVTSSAREAWRQVLSNWRQNEPDALTHATADWALRRLGTEVTPIRHRPPNAEWQVNSIGMTMVNLRAGALVRDLSGVRKHRFVFRQILLITRPFLLSNREVTRAQFQQFVDDPAYPADEKPRDWIGPEFQISPTERHPVQRVSWYDSILFCNWLSRREALTPCYERTGEREQVGADEYDVWRLNPSANGYRLPTNAEAEYAFRAGAATRFSVGDQITLLNRYSVRDASRAELPGSRLPNGWGLFDMHGNLWEWCHDRHGLYGAEAVLRDPAGPVQGVERVIRGGSFVSSASAVLGKHLANTRSAKLGFRVTRWRGAPALDSIDPLLFENTVRKLSENVAHDPVVWKQAYDVAALQRFVGDERGYRETCKKMLARFEGLMRSQGRHELLFAHLFFSGGEVTEEIMNLARQHAEDGRPANLRMLGLALYRIGKDEQALSLLKKAATTRLSPDGKITSLLCLALVQLRMGDLEEARYTIRQARKVQDNSPDRSRSTHRMPWGVIPSLWREVRTAMEAADIEEPIPELPLAFEEWVARSAPTDAVE